MVKIGTDHYWDGGIVSNTPLQHLLDQDDNLNTLVFQVDLFSARGVLPRDIQDVLARHKDIMYSSRTRYNTDVFRRIHNWQVALYQALSRMPEELLNEQDRELKQRLARLPDIAILHIICQQKAFEGHAKTMSSPARRCASIARAVTKTPNERSSIKMADDATAGLRYHRPRRPPRGRLI